MINHSKKKDTSMTSLYCGENVCKNNPKIEALGSLDELITTLGVFRHMTRGSGFDSSVVSIVTKFIKNIQIRLFVVGTEIATIDDSLIKIKDKISKKDVLGLIKLDKHIKNKYKIPKGFVIPGGTGSMVVVENFYPSLLDVCRVKTRKLERDLITIKSQRGIDSHNSKDFSILLEWINKLSSVIWSLARVLELLSYDCLQISHVEKPKTIYDLEDL